MLLLVKILNCSASKTYKVTCVKLYRKEHGLNFAPVGLELYMEKESSVLQFIVVFCSTIYMAACS